MNFKSAILYFLYTITAFFIFAWIFFPGQKAATILSDKLNTLSDHVKVRISKVTPGGVLTCKLTHTEINIDNEIILASDSFKLSPSLFSMFSAKKKATFEIAKGNLSVYKSKFSFVATGELTALNDRQTGGHISCSDIVTIIDDIPILHLMKMPELIFSNIDFEFIKGKNKIEILNFYAKGTQCNIKTKGSISLSPESGEINLDFETDIQPNPSYLSKFTGISLVSALFNDSKTSIKLHIGGTLENPTIKL